MPEKDGYEVCEAIKTSAAWSQVPVLLLTGAFEPFDQERAARAGYDGSLAKPFEPETLIAKVKELLARAPARPPAPSPARTTVVAPPPSAPPTPARAAAPPPPPSPVVPFPRPAITPPPVPQAAPSAPATAIPFAPPASNRPPATPSRFIPDEPFGALDVSAFSGEAPAAKPLPIEPLMPLTSEESATLSAPVAPGPPAPDTATTVMFRPGELPWAAPAAPSGAAAAPAPVERAAEPGGAAVLEPALVPEGPESADKEVEGSVFEEVLEEDLEFGASTFAPTHAAGASPAATVEVGPFTPQGPTPPPVAPASDEATTGAFVAVEIEREQGTFAPPGHDAVPSPLKQPTPPAEATSAAFGLGREELTFEPEPELVVAPELPRAPVGRPPARPSAQESFADIAPELDEPKALPPTPSEAAAVAVPVDMVEKIAQRVVAQISERVVREIAWDVIPDLAEALIKQEIERLKAELQKT
jgi:hypothetical protein